MGLFSATGQTSSSSTSQSDSNNTDSNNTENSNNVQNSILDGTINSVSYKAGGNVTLTDPGIIDAAGQMFGGAISAIQRTSETAFGMVQRIVEEGFGSANRATEVVASTSSAAIDQVAAANGRPTLGIFDRYGLWIVGGVGALVMAWIFTRKGGK